MNWFFSESTLVNFKWIENDLIIFGTDASEIIKVDIDKKSSATKIKLNTSITALGVVPNENIFIVGDAKGYLHFVDGLKMIETERHHVHKSWVRGISVVPGKQNLVFSAGDDGRVMTGTGNPMEFHVLFKRGWLGTLSGFLQNY